MNPGKLSEVHHIAVVARVERGPSILVARTEPNGLALFPGEKDAKEVDEKIARALSRKMTRFQVAERLRAGLVRDLPSRAPWTHLVPAVQVSSALETLLVDHGDDPPDFDALRPLGADAVLELAVKDFGVRRSGGRVGAWARISGHLFTLPGRDSMYRRAIELDDAREGRVEIDPLPLLRAEGGYRESLEDLLGRAASSFAEDLGGKKEKPPERTPAPAQQVDEEASSAE